MQLTQRARQELLQRSREHDGSGARVFRLSLNERGDLRMERRAADSLDVLLHDEDEPLLAVDHGILLAYNDPILHYRASGDGVSEDQGWVLLQPRGSHARAGLAERAVATGVAPAPSAKRSGILRLVGGFVHLLR